MPAYSIDKFLNSKLAETIVYTTSDGVDHSIKACVNRQTMAQYGIQKAEQNLNFYPLSIVISKRDIPNVVTQADSVTLPDMTGKTVNTKVRKIILSDEESWTIGV